MFTPANMALILGQPCARKTAHRYAHMDLKCSHSHGNCRDNSIAHVITAFSFTIQARHVLPCTLHLSIGKEVRLIRKKEREGGKESGGE
jgi:hypothetical protein